MMNVRRIAKHLLLTQGQVERAFPSKTLIAIEQAIKVGETSHVGEIRFVVEGGLDGRPLFKGQSTRERAIDVFSHLRIWDTEHNTGLLIYLLLADRAVEIVADRGLHSKVGSREWTNICRRMETAFKQSNFESGVIAGIQAVTRHLAINFPESGSGRNELADRPVLL